MNWLNRCKEVFQHSSRNEVQKNKWFNEVSKGLTETQWRAWMKMRWPIDTLNDKGETALMCAINHYQYQSVLWLLEAGADLSKANASGDTVFMQAIKAEKTFQYKGFGILDKVMARIRSEPETRSLLVNAKNHSYETPLCLAVIGEHESLVRELIEWGAEVDEISTCGWTLLIMAIQRCNESIVRQLLEKKVRLDVEDAKKNTALMFALMNEDWINAEALIQANASVHVKNVKGKTPLMWAVRGGSMEMVEQLIEKGVSINDRDLKGRSALYHALKIKRADLVDRLMQAGALPDEKVLEKAWDSDTLGLIEKGLCQTINTFRENGETILMRVIKKMSKSLKTEAVRYLLSQGADVNMKDQEGDTALIMAVRKGEKDIVEELLKAGARINEQNHCGFNAVMWAVGRDDLEVLEVLMNHHAELHLKCHLGQGVLDFVSKKDRCFSLLKEALNLSSVESHEDSLSTRSWKSYFKTKISS